MSDLPSPEAGLTAAGVIDEMTIILGDKLSYAGTWQRKIAAALDAFAAAALEQQKVVNAYEPMREALKIAHELLSEEYEALLLSVCSCPSGEPDRSTVDDESLPLVEQYEGALARIRELVPDLVTGSASSTEVKP